MSFSFATFVTAMTTMTEKSRVWEFNIKKGPPEGDPAIVYKVNSRFIPGVTNL